MNNTKCLICGTISKGEKCNECGGFNVPAPHYHENGTVFCTKCSALYKYPVRICGMCFNDMLKGGK